MKNFLLFNAFAVLLAILPVYAGEYDYYYYADVLEYCNENPYLGELVYCAEPYICHNGYRQCLIPAYGMCDGNSWLCADGYCYHGYCLPDYQIPKCHYDDQCDYYTYCGYHLSGEYACIRKKDDDCSDGYYACEGYLSCIDGKCQEPKQNYFCDPYAEYPQCPYGLVCDHYIWGCIVPKGGYCYSNVDCGGDFVAVCRDGKCKKPGKNDKCLPYDTYYLKATKCAVGICDPYLERCRKKEGHRCRRDDDCVYGTVCKYGRCAAYYYEEEAEME